MMGVFAEFERAMIRDRVNSGLARARRRNDPRSPEAGRTLHKRNPISSGERRQCPESRDGLQGKCRKSSTL
ncbi:recombinase family protein [Labrenzia sp. DG1229]|uniref:recombinase family protein n=1 Tax=Labrenzia sp. DG1229 TaxID=681847 RepID=UPI00336A2AC2